MIEVGEYVRTNDGLIEIVEENLGYRSFLYHCVCYKTNREDVLEERAIVKHSKNIIDLIEVGDYVNGEKIITITNDRHLLLDRNVYLFDKYREIKTILTKEQYKANCYKLERE